MGGLLDEATLAGLVVTAALAATPLPVQSEIVLLALHALGQWPLWLLVTVATFGNVLGALVTYGIGRGIGGKRAAGWIRLSPERLARAEQWFSRWGIWAVMFAWLPMGEVIIFLAGSMRLPVWQFIVISVISRAGRYAALALGLDGILHLFGA